MMSLIRLGLVALLAFVFSCSLVSAQPHVAVEPARILIGPEFVPRFATLPGTHLVVPAGQSQTLSADATFDAIEVGGTLTIAAGVTVRASHVQVLPGGLLRVTGSCDTTTRIIIRGTPIDTSRDPFRWGRGLVNFGRREFTGCELGAAWTLLPNDAEAGASTLTFAVPPGWQVGDELLMPDTAQIPQPDFVTGRNPARREPSITIASIAANRQSLTLATPLTFEHHAIRDPQGAVIARVPVANLTRRVLVTSEDLTQPGHVADVGHQASMRDAWVAYRGLGRTTHAPLNSTPADLSHIGTNQVGRYLYHCHHCQGFGSSSTGVVYDGGGAPGKWGFALHGSSDMVIAQPVIVDVKGAGFVTEDGNEARWTLDKALIAYIDPGLSVRDGFGGFPPNPSELALQGRPGIESALWTTSVRDAVITDLQVWNSMIGYSPMGSLVKGHTRIPSVPGGPQDTEVSLNARAPWQTFTRAVIAANSFTGIDYWQAQGTITDVVIAQNAGPPITTGPSIGNIHLHRAQIGGVGNVCVGTTQAYILSFELIDSAVWGCLVGVNSSGGRRARIVRTTIDAAQVGIDMSVAVPHHGSRLESVRCTHPTAPCLVFGPDTPAWQPGQPTPTQMVGEHTDAMHVLIDWQGTGQDYRLYEPKQRRDNAAWMVSGTWPTEMVGSPEPGLTLGQVWDRYHFAPNGGVYAQSDVVSVPKLARGAAVRGLAGPVIPRFAVVAPSPFYPPIPVGAPDVSLRGALTGPLPALAISPSGNTYFPDARVRVTVDGQSYPQTVAYTLGDDALGSAMIRLDSAQAITNTPGTKTLRTWREDANGNEIPGSAMVSTFVVGSPSPEKPINCTLSEWSDPAWTVTSETDTAITVSRTRTRTVVTPASNGGTCDGSLSDPQTRTVSLGSSLPSQVEAEIRLPDGTYRGTLPKVN